MYDIFELRNMELDQLHALATELGMKSFKRMDKDKLVYAILDEAARQKAKNVPEKPAQKRGRVKKVEEKAVKKENEKSEKNTENPEKPDNGSTKTGFPKGKILIRKFWIS
jgi:transcription termination factor Rho